MKESKNLVSLGGAKESAKKQTGKLTSVLAVDSTEEPVLPETPDALYRASAQVIVFLQETLNIHREEQ